MGKADKIKCDTRNDIYKVDVVNTFNNYGRYDDLNIQKVQYLEVESEYSDLFIGKLENRADIKMKYGRVTLDYVSPDFYEITLDGNETDFKIQVGENAAYQLQVKSRYCPIRIPDLVKMIEHEDSQNQKEIKGYLGYNAPRVIKANMKSGSFKLK